MLEQLPRPPGQELQVEVRRQAGTALEVLNYRVRVAVRSKPTPRTVRQLMPDPRNASTLVCNQ